MMQFFFFFFSHFTTNCIEHDYVNGADHGAVNDPVGSTALYIGVVFDGFSVWYALAWFVLLFSVTFTYIVTYLVEFPELSSATPLVGSVIRVPGFSVYCHAIHCGFA